MIATACDQTLDDAMPPKTRKERKRLARRAQTRGNTQVSRNATSTNFDFGLVTNPEPEVAASRPCGCHICRDVPEPQVELQAADSSACPNPQDPPVASIFAGAYPRGLGRVALAELSRAGGMVRDLFEAHCVVLFALPLRSPEAPPVEFGSFDALFELVGGAVLWLPPTPSLADIAAVADSSMRPLAGEWRSALRAFGRWRFSGHRIGSTHGVKTPQLAPFIGGTLAAIGAVSLTDGCTAGPVVDLEKFDVEVVVLLSDGVDELRVAVGGGQEGETREALASSLPKLMLLGVRRCRGPAGHALCRTTSLQIEKGAVVSRANDTIAFCVAQLAADLLALPAPPPAGTACMEEASACTSSRREPPVVAQRCLDPMCGVGTYLLALHCVTVERGLAAELLGVDADAESVALARRNGTSGIAFLRGSSAALPLRDGSIDLVLVDPPWGQRHASHSYVKRLMPRWAREWTRVLRPGGVLIVVTICSSFFEGQVLRPLELRGVLWLEEALQFDNKGWTQCKLYVARRL